MRSAIATVTTMTEGRICPHTEPERLPRSQKRTDWVARGSALKKTRKLETEEKAADMTTPVRMRRRGVIPPCAMEMPKTSAVAMSAPPSAPKDSAQIPSPLKIPSTMTSVAPTPAPEETPRR